MKISGIKITHRTVYDEAHRAISVYGLEIQNGDTVSAYPDLCTDRRRLELLCEILGDEIPDERLLFELFEDYIF